MKCEIKRSGVTISKLAFLSADERPKALAPLRTQQIMGFNMIPVFEQQKDFELVLRRYTKGGVWLVDFSESPDGEEAR